MKKGLWFLAKSDIKIGIYQHIYIESRINFCLNKQMIEVAL